MGQTNTPIAKLAVISLKKLKQRDSAELALLLHACQEDGFLHLDLRGCGTILNDWRDVLAQMGTYFDQPPAEKLQDNYCSDNQG
jgi:isopenicillin N synthase-like dioxygenase